MIFTKEWQVEREKENETEKDRLRGTRINDREGAPKNRWQNKGENAKNRLL